MAQNKLCVMWLAWRFRSAMGFPMDSPMPEYELIIFIIVIMHNYMCLIKLHLHMILSNAEKGIDISI